MEKTIADQAPGLTDVDQLKEEILNQQSLLRELNSELQSASRQLVLATQENQGSNFQQQQVKIEQDRDLTERIQALKEKIHLDENQAIDLRRRMWADDIPQEQRRALRDQIQNEKSILLGLENQKREFDLNWATQKLGSDANAQSYRQSLRDSISTLKETQAAETKKLALLQKALSDAVKINSQLLKQKSAVESLNQ